MKFLVDNQLPAALARWLATASDAIHVLDRGMEAASDSDIWQCATDEGRIVVSKDEDFFHLSNRPTDTGRLLWVRIGNCRTSALLARFEKEWPAIRREFDSGQRVVELR